MKNLDHYLQNRRFYFAGKRIRPHSKLLDIGCNSGEFFIYLRDKEISGVGIDSNIQIDTSQLPSGVDFISSQFPCEKLSGLQFDYITALAVLEHIPDDAQNEFAKACFDLLLAGGQVIITVPSPFVDIILAVLKFFRLLDGMEEHQHHGFKVSETIPLFGKAGFKLRKRRKFQFGLNNLFVFEKTN